MITYKPSECEWCDYMAVDSFCRSYCFRLFQLYWKSEADLEAFEGMLDTVFEEEKDGNVT